MPTWGQRREVCRVSGRGVPRLRGALSPWLGSQPPGSRQLRNRKPRVPHLWHPEQARSLLGQPGLWTGSLWLPARCVRYPLSSTRSFWLGTPPPGIWSSLSHFSPSLLPPLIYVPALMPPPQRGLCLLKNRFPIVTQSLVQLISRHMASINFVTYLLTACVSSKI